MDGAVPERGPPRASTVRALPRGGLSVTVLGLGCAQIGGLFQPMPLDTAFRLLDAAWDAGIRYFDTAPYYGYTRSERRVGAYLCERDRAAYRISTKAGRLMVPAEAVGPRNSAMWRPCPFPPATTTATTPSCAPSRTASSGSASPGSTSSTSTTSAAHTHGAANGAPLGRADARRRLPGAGAAAPRGARRRHRPRRQRGGRRRATRWTRRSSTPCCWPAATRCWNSARCRCSTPAPGPAPPSWRRAPFNSGILAGGATFDYAAAPPEVVARVAALRAACARFAVPVTAAALQFPLAHPAVVVRRGGGAVARAGARQRGRCRAADPGRFLGRAGPRRAARPRLAAPRRGVNPPRPPTRERRLAKAPKSAISPRRRRAPQPP